MADDPEPIRNRVGHRIVEKPTEDDFGYDWRWEDEDLVERLSRSAATLVCDEIAKDADIVLEVDEGVVCIQFDALDGTFILQAGLLDTIDRMIPRLLEDEDETQAAVMHAFEEACRRLRKAIGDA
jgi:hypothetical protein